MRMVKLWRKSLQYLKAAELCLEQHVGLQLEGSAITQLIAVHIYGIM